MFRPMRDGACPVGQVGLRRGLVVEFEVQTTGPNTRSDVVTDKISAHQSTDSDSVNKLLVSCHDDRSWDIYVFKFHSKMFW